MKKNVIKILIFIILFNYIFTQTIFVRAEETEEKTTEYNFDENAYNQSNDDGTTTAPNGTTTGVGLAATESTPGAVAGTMAKTTNFIPEMMAISINGFVNEGGFINFNTSIDGITEEDFKYISIEKILFGTYYLLNANIFKNSAQDSLNVTNQKGEEPDNTTPLVPTLDELRESVQTWYYIMRLLAFGIGLITLIYIGIRMAISTTGENQGRYKKMLWGWVQSIVIIVLLPYIMTLLNFVAQILMDIINALRNAMLSSGEKSFEVTTIKFVCEELENSGGFELASNVIVYIILMWAQFRFFMMYMKRLLAVSFLTIISPLITITYSIDKAGDGQAQAFNAWFREYMMNILIQPLQAILYLIFVFSANQIAAEAPVIGIVFLLSLTRAEKIVKTIFNMRGLVSMHTMKLFSKSK